MRDVESDVGIDDQVKAWLENYMADGETRLFVNDIKSVWSDTIGSSLTANWKALPVVCEGKPSVQTKASTVPPNGGCPEVYTKANVSCTCLEGYDTATEWEFYIQSRTRLENQPLVLEFGATLGLTSLVTIVAPSNITSIKIVGVGEDIVTLNTTAEATGWQNYDTSNPSLIEGSTTSVLKKITLENVDLYAAMDTSSNYIPMGIETLILRNANISQITGSFLLGFANLASLDLSHNKLHGPYSRISSQMCTANPCPLKSINVSYNALQEIPYRLFYLNQLESLVLNHNDITNYTISNDLFEHIARLVEFSMDTPTLSNACDNGTLKAAHGITFCVLQTSTVAMASETSSESNKYLIYTILTVCVIVASILIWVVLRHRRTHTNRKDCDNSGFDHTISFESQGSTPMNLLINDPILHAHRIPLKHVKVANCINKGGFGLVYSGAYNRRPNACLSLDPCDRPSAMQVVYLIQQIQSHSSVSYAEGRSMDWSSQSSSQFLSLG
ncbi:hypothetical protein CCR75_004193 [Bremia lactucae]|uniref:Uncharacterized protein n=1 Tax=Bremia lactucae TaxID=4779 RepID=A0A976FKB1_BRELC|nr:hypothetical protein CCR75_004193 [Bremia lactucae]